MDRNKFGLETNCTNITQTGPGIEPWMHFHKAREVPLHYLLPRQTVPASPERSAMHSRGQRSCKGKPRLAKSKIAQECPMATKLAEVYCIHGVEGSEGVSQGQAAVKLLRNAIWQPKLVRRTLD